MRARLVRMEPGYRGRQRIVIEIAGDFREQFDQLQGALLEVQITRAIPLHPPYHHPRKGRQSLLQLHPV